MPDVTTFRSDYYQSISTSGHVLARIYTRAGLKRSVVINSTKGTLQRGNCLKHPFDPSFPCLLPVLEIAISKNEGPTISLNSQVSKRNHSFFFLIAVEIIVPTVFKIFIRRLLKVIGEIKRTKHQID